MNYYDFFLPISIFILSLILIICLIRESLIKNSLVKFRLTIAIIIAFFLVIVCVFFNSIETSSIDSSLPMYMIILLPLCIILIGILTYSSIVFSSREKKIKDIYFSCVEESNYYVYLTKRNKIKSCSKALINYFGSSKKEVLKKKFGNLLISNYSNFNINGIDYKQDDINKIFDNIAKSNMDLNLNIRCLDKNGKDVSLRFTDRPIKSGGKYVGHILFGNNEKRSVQEEKVVNQSDESMLKLRFSVLLEQSNEPLYFYNISSNSIWGNDAFVKEFNFSGNSITYDEFKNRIHPDDLAFYTNIIDQISIKKPKYDTKFRIKCKNEYVYVEERGKKIFKDNMEIISFISKLVNGNNQKNNMSFIEGMKKDGDLLADLSKIVDDSFVQVSCLSLDNVKEINAEFGRSVGDMVMNEYVKAIKNAFVDNDMIYRTDGLIFYFLTIDFKKMENLKNLLQKNMVLTANSKYGAMTVTIKASIGLITNKHIKDPKTLINFAKKTMDVTKTLKSSERYKYYDD